MYKVIYYQNTKGESPVEEFIGSFPVKTRAKILKWLELLEENGPDLPRPYSDSLRDKIRELRVSEGKLAIRLLYFFWKDKIIVVTNGLVKKANSVTEREIEKAITYMNDFIIREEKNHGQA